MRTKTVLCLLGLTFSATAQRFVRFIATDGKTYSGDAILPPNDTDAAHSKQAKVITGDILGDFTITNQVKTIKTLLSPLDPEKTRTGFNYVAHAMEANVTIPQFPILFYKPWTALNNPIGPIPVTAGYQNQTNFTSTMDYETELVVVMKKKAFNITEDVALDHVLGYTGRATMCLTADGKLTVEENLSHSTPWARVLMGGPPTGPAIVSTSIIKDPQTLNLWTKVNGVLKQNDTTANMIFGVAQLVSFFSMGITLLPGDIIFTGTPSGVNLGKADPQWLTNGDVVEVGTENIGTCTNTITYV